MRISCLFTGKTRETYIAQGIDDYLSRIRRYAEIELIQTRDIRSGKNDNPAKIMEKEGRLLLTALPKHSKIVVLDRGGRQLSSEGLAELFKRWELQNRRTISFVIGGHLGLSPSVLDQAEESIALSQMTFTHEMARLILLEQIYRAFCINAGTVYHK